MSQSAQVVLAVGSSRDVLLRGGPAAWLGKPSQYFRGAESEDDTVASVNMLEEVAHPFTAARVLCHKLGEAKIRVMVGNKESATNKWVADNLVEISSNISISQEAGLPVQKDPSNLLRAEQSVQGRNRKYWSQQRSD